MSLFSRQVRDFAKEAERRIVAVHTSTVVELRRSWVEGSPITGAPPLPMATGNAATVGKLRRSVRVNYMTPTTALIFTDVPYAEEVEHNLRGVQFSRGGAHGWKLTVAGANRVVEMVERRVAGHGR